MEALNSIISMTLLESRIKELQFCKVSINDIGQGNGLFFGDTKLFLMQLASIGITIVVSVAGTLICYGITRLVTGKIRVTEREERVGLDRSQHGESAYPSFNGLD